MSMIEILPFTEQWQKDFSVIAAVVRQALGGLALRVDHIGSTSVPGLDAKDVIDVQVTVLSLTPSPPLIEAFATAGYSLYQEIQHDHVPPGFCGPPEEWQKLYFRPPVEQRPTHMHVRVQGRANQRYALLFRDYLRAHPSAAAGYAEVKRQLARHHPRDVDVYYDVKDPVCDIIIAGAESWAATTRWISGPSDA